MKFGQYELLERIAIGGMAEVYKGRVVGAEGFEKLVAIKRIQPDLIADERFVTMLLTEARIHSALSHRNIVQIHDLGISEEGEYFIVLEYVEGYDLRAIMESITADGEIIPEALSLHIAAEVAQGLHFAHELRGPDRQPLGLIHRDVSPSNVLISFAGEVKLSDFGLAKRRHDRSVVGSLKGNLIYMSPEQARQAPLDRRTDVFSLGALLFELLTGKRMREITDEIKGWGEVAAGVVRSARSVRPDLPHSFEALLNQALAAEPARRFADAGTFGAAIRQVLAQMNTPVGPADLQALLSVVRPPKKPRGELERSKVIRLVPEPELAKGRLAPQGAAPQVNRPVGTTIGASPVDRLRAKQATAAPPPAPTTSPGWRPAPPPAAAKLPEDIESFPPTPPPVAAPAAPPARRPAAAMPLHNPPAHSSQGSPHNTWAGGFSLASTPAAGRSRPAAPASTLMGALAPADDGAAGAGAIEGRRAPAAPTSPGPTPPGPIGQPAGQPAGSAAGSAAGWAAGSALGNPGKLPIGSRARAVVAREAPRALSPGPEVAVIATPGPTPLPTPTPASPLQDWSARPTPPPSGSPAAHAAAVETATPAPAVPSPRDGAPSAPSWQPLASSVPSSSPSSSQPTWQPLPPPQDSPPTRDPAIPLPALPIGLWRWVAVGVAGVLVVTAFIIHVAVVPLEVLVAWTKPAQLYVASEPEGGIAKLDGVRLIDPTPSKIPVTRDRLDHVIEIEYPGYRPVRETVRFDRSVALSFMVALQKEVTEPIVPVSDRR